MMSPFLALPPPDCSIPSRGSEEFHSPVPWGMQGSVSSDLSIEPRRRWHRAPSDPPVPSQPLQRETQGTFRPFSPDGWHRAAPGSAPSSQTKDKLPKGAASSRELLLLPVNEGDGQEGTSRACISCIP